MPQCPQTSSKLSASRTRSPHTSKVSASALARGLRQRAEFAFQQAQQHRRFTFHAAFHKHILIEPGFFQTNVVIVEHFLNLLAGEFGQFIDQHGFQLIS